MPGTTTWVDHERRALTAELRRADPEAPTLCAGWTVRQLCAHLVQRQEAIWRNLWDQLTTRTPGEERFMRRLVDDAGTPEGYTALVDTFEAGPSRRSLMGRFDEALNLLEYVVHHEDVRRGSGSVAPRELPQAELEEIWRRARLILRRGYRKAPVGVVLGPTGGPVTEVRTGPDAITLTGPAMEVLLHAFGRRAAADVQLDGPREGIDAFTAWAARP